MNEIHNVNNSHILSRREMPYVNDDYDNTAHFYRSSIVRWHPIPMMLANRFMDEQINRCMDGYLYIHTIVQMDEWMLCWTDCAVKKVSKKYARKRWKTTQKSKKSQFFSKTSKCFQLCPNACECIPMGPNGSASLEKLAKTSKKLAKTSKNFVKNFVKSFFQGAVGVC